MYRINRGLVAPDKTRNISYLQTVRLILKYCLIFCDVPANCSAKIRNNSRSSAALLDSTYEISYRKLSVRFPVEFRSEITANTREMFVVVKLSWRTSARPCSSKHNTRFQWSDPLKIKFLAFTVMTRRFHPGTCNTMRSHLETAVHQLVK